MKKTLTVLPGDGIGPEITRQAIKVIEAVCRRFKHEFHFEYADFGAVSIDKHGTPLTEEALIQCMESDAVLLGAIGDPRFDGNTASKVRPEQGLLRLRKEMGVFANIRPINTYEQLLSAGPLKESQVRDVDIVIYRELTGGIYFGEKSTTEDNSYASDLCAYTREEIERTAKLAFEAAEKRRGQLCLVDKANVLATSRLWRSIVQEMAKDYPNVETSYMFVDNAAMQLMLNPRQFDVILTGNMFGDIISDLASVITGSIGMLPSSSIGKYNALFEPIHGSYPQAAGKNIANPMATILSAAMMFRYFGLQEEADLIQEAVNWALQLGFVTRDISPTNFETTSRVGELIAIYIEDNEKLQVNHNSIDYSKNGLI